LRLCFSGDWLKLEELTLAPSSNCREQPNIQQSAAAVNPLCSQPFKENNMDFDEDKIDEYTLALLYLVTYDR
jgi:hypothetical protein